MVEGKIMAEKLIEAKGLRTTFLHPNPNKSEPKRFKRKSITIDSADKAIGRISF